MTYNYVDFKCIFRICECSSCWIHKTQQFRCHFYLAGSPWCASSNGRCSKSWEWDVDQSHRGNAMGVCCQRSRQLIRCRLDKGPPCRSVQRLEPSCGCCCILDGFQCRSKAFEAVMNCTDNTMQIIESPPRQSYRNRVFDRSITN